MPNWKMLGVEKDINEYFGNQSADDLIRLNASEYFEHPSITRREPSNYCMVRVIDCQRDNWWYANLIGFEFFCEIRYTTYNNRKWISSYEGVILTNTKKIILRGFDPKDVIII